MHEMLHTIGIQDLALELIQEIVLCASSERWDGAPRKSDLKTLRQISRPFKHAADPLLFSEITFNFVRRPLGSVVDQLNDLAAHATPASKYTRILDIQSTRTQLDNPIAHNPIAHGKFGMLLLHAVKALHNLRSVRWNLGAFEGFYTILDGLAELKRLEELDLNFFALPKPWQTADMIVLRRFGNLRSIKIHGESLSPELSNSLLLQLRKTNQTSPSLEVLEYDVPPMATQPETGDGSILPDDCLLHDVVEGVPENSPLRLKRLRVSGWSLRLDSMTLPHLRRLTHLDINQYQCKHHRLAHMWNVLNRESIHLRSIRTDTFSEQFISYLLSYTGLEDLWMAYNQDVIHGPNLPTIISDLYHLALPNHKETLKVFKELNRSDVAHCVHPDYMVSMQNCHKLRTMMITVNAAELGLREKIQETLTSALNIPLLQTLDVDYTRAARPRLGHRCKCRNLRAWRLTSQLFVDIVKSLDIQESVRRDLSSCQIIFDKRRYIVQENENGGLGFQPNERMRVIVGKPF